MPVDLSIVTVIDNAATAQVACALLDSVSQSRFSGSLEVILVSNGVPDEILRPLSDAHGWVTFLQADWNLGYAGGNNWGMLKSSGRLILLLNPDIVLEPDSLSNLVSFVDAHPGVGGATGKLLGDDGKVQIGFNVRGLPTFFSAVFDALLLYRAFPWTFVSGNITNANLFAEAVQVGLY